MLYDVVDIMAIPLEAEVAEDDIYWFFEPRGFYSVRSGYHLANRIASGRVLGVALETDFWKNHIWRIGLIKSSIFFGWVVRTIYLFALVSI